MLVEQPLHDLLAQSHAALAAAAKAAAEAPPEPEPEPAVDSTDAAMGAETTGAVLSSPQLVQAEIALDGIRKMDICELMAIRRPPMIVIKSFRCVAMILHEEGQLPEEHRALRPTVRHLQTEAKSDDWTDFRHLALRNPSGFMQLLKQCTATCRGRAARSRYSSIYTQDPEFSPQRGAMASRLAGVLCEWCLAVLNLRSANSTSSTVGEEEAAAVASGSRSHAAMARFGKKCAAEDAQFVTRVRNGDALEFDMCTLTKDAGANHRS